MEATVTAIEMRRKFGGILDRVVGRGEHITILRDGRPLATLIPASEHEAQCQLQDRVRTVGEVLNGIEGWQKKNRVKLRKISRCSLTAVIREMREGRWSSSTPRSP